MLKIHMEQGCFALTNTGNEIVHSNNGLLSTVAYQKEGEILSML